MYRGEIELSWAFERVVHKYIDYENKPCRYAPGIELSSREIHAVVIIGENEGISLGELAHDRGVTKGAMSQIVTRLAKKGLVEKRASELSGAHIALYLTDRGKQAWEGHSAYHRNLGETIDRKLFDRMSDEDIRRTTHFFEEFEALLDEVLER